MDKLVFSANGRTYDDFKKQISSSLVPLFGLLRDYCLSLGENVVEDIRMHRIVFCKSVIFRSFADMEPSQEMVIIKIKKDRKLPQKEIIIKPDEDLSEVKNLLLDAYNCIH